jgi:hypothetical protein
LNLRGAALGCVALSVFADGACGDSTVDVFDPDLGLLAHWALDESQAGSVVLDSSGFALDGTVSSGPPVPTLDIPPVHFPDPHSLSFNGQDEYVVFGNPPILNLGGPISVAAWVRPTRTDGYRDIVAHGYTPDKAEDLALRIESGTYDFTYWNGQDHHGVATVPPSDVGAWVHLCGVFDGGTYRLYRNGELAATTADTTAPPANINALWSIGARAPESDAGARFLEGEIDDARIYGRALSAAEVQALYQR